MASVICFRTSADMPRMRQVPSGSRVRRRISIKVQWWEETRGAPREQRPVVSHLFDAYLSGHLGLLTSIPHVFPILVKSVTVCIILLRLL